MKKLLIFLMPLFVAFCFTPVRAENRNLSPTGTLPVLWIYCEDGSIADYNLSDKNYRDGTYWLDCKGLNGWENIGSADSQLPLEIKARGNYTRTGFCKKPFKLKLDKKQSPMGLTNSKHFALLNHADDDRGFMRNYVGFWLGQAMAAEGEEGRCMWSPREIPVEVMLNGEYWGLYFFTESIRVDENRINITELDDNETDMSLITGGYLVELDNYEDENQIFLYDDDPNLAVRVTYDTPEIYSPIQKEFVTEQFTRMKNLVAKRGGEGSDELWSYMDLDAAARYYVIMEATGHWEAYHGSTYLYRDHGADRKWVFSPVWDFGHALESESGAENRYLYDSGYPNYGNTWIRYMWANQKFQEKVKQTWRWFMNNKMESLFADLDTYCALIDQAADRDYERWEGVMPNNTGVNDPTAIADNRDMANRKAQVRSFLTNKFNWLNGQWGTPSADSPKPEIDDTPAAPLPSQFNPDAKTFKVYYRNADGSASTPVKIWLWSDTRAFTGADWNDRPSLTRAVAADGKEYFYTTFTYVDEDLTNAQIIITENENKTIGSPDGEAFTPNMLYVANGDNVSDWIPGDGSEGDGDGDGDDNDDDSVWVYLYNDAGWAEPINAYVYIDKTHANGGWPGAVMTRMSDDASFNGVQASADKGYYKYKVPSTLTNGYVMFSSARPNERYPEDGADGLPIGNTSVLFKTSGTTLSEGTVTEPVAAAPSKALPILYINTTDGAAVPEDKSKIAASAYIDNASSGANWSVGSTASPVEVDIKGHGSSSWTDFEKKPYKLKFDKKQTFGDIPKSKHYLLMPYTSDSELGFMRNLAGHELSRQIGLSWTPTQAPVEIVINGEYMGLYFLTENIRPAGDRINQYDMGDLDDDVTDGNYPEEWHNWILEIDNTLADEEAVYSAIDPLGHKINFGIEGIDFPDDCPASKVEDYTRCLKADLGLLMENIRLMSERPNNFAGWNSIIDVAEAAKFVIVQELMDDPNAFNTAFYLNLTDMVELNERTPGALWKFGPVWDFSGAFVNKGHKQSLYTDDGTKSWPIISALYKNSDFRTTVVRQFLLFTKGYDPMAPESSSARRRILQDTSDKLEEGTKFAEAVNNLTAIGASVAKGVEADAARWGTYYSTLNSTSAANAADHEGLVETVQEYLANNRRQLADYLNEDMLTGLKGVETSLDAPAEYFDLTGRRISNPEKGSICIRRQGTVVSKYVVR